MTDAGFDRDRHLRDRVRRAESRAVHLDAQLERAWRVLAILSQAAAGPDGDPLAALEAAERLDAHEQRVAWWTPDRLAVLLRQTNGGVAA